MNDGTGLSLSLAWASAATAERAVDDFCWARLRAAAIGAGASLEYAAKAAVAHCIGPNDLFEGPPVLSVAERWVAGDYEVRARTPPPPAEIADARASLLRRRTIGPEAAVEKLTPHIDSARRSDVQAAARRVMRARNAAVHLGDTEVPLTELADEFVVAVGAMWLLVPAAAAGQWGLFHEVAKVGVLGRRDSWQHDKAIRLAQARVRFHSMGTIFVHRSNQLAGLHETRCTVCNSAAFYDPKSNQPSPPIVPRDSGDTIAVVDCTVCGLTLWGPQIGPPEYR